MNNFSIHRQTVAKIYTDEAKLLEINIAQCRNLIQNITEKYNKNPQEWHLTAQNNISTEIENKQRRLETCISISNWLLGKNIETDDDDD